MTTRRVSGFALTLLIVGLAAISILMVAVPAATGTRAFTVDRNSMQRVVPFGALEFAHPETDYEVGQVVVYTRNGNVITHRLVEELPDPATGVLSGTLFRTQGSENAVPDDYTTPKDHIIGKVVGHIPYAGLATKVINTLPIRVFLILSAVGLLYLSTRRPSQALAVPAHA